MSFLECTELVDIDFFFKSLKQYHQRNDILPKVPHLSCAADRWGINSNKDINN